MPTRKGYVAAMRKKNATTTPQSTGPGPVRRAGETAAKAVYKTLNPAVKATTGAMVKGIGAYAKGTNALAEKIRQRLPKGTPTPSNRGPRRRMTK